MLEKYRNAVCMEVIWDGEVDEELLLCESPCKNVFIEFVLIFLNQLEMEIYTRDEAVLLQVVTRFLANYKEMLGIYVQFLS